MYPNQHFLSVILSKLCKEMSSYDNGINLLNIFDTVPCIHGD